MTCLVSLSSALDPHKYVVYNGRKLYEFREKTNFFEAFLHCESLNLQLLTLRSVDEFVELNNIMYTSFDGYEYWMGRTNWNLGGNIYRMERKFQMFCPSSDLDVFIFIQLLKV